MKGKELAVIKKKKSVQIKNAAWDALSIESQQAYKHDYDLFFRIIQME